MTPDKLFLSTFFFACIFNDKRLPRGTNENAIVLLPKLNLIQKQYSHLKKKNLKTSLPTPTFEVGEDLGKESHS